MQSKATGYAVVTGLNEIDPEHYGTSGLLYGCENDAADKHRMLFNLGYNTECFVSRRATAETVIGRLAEIASLAKAGDIVVWSNSSHGTYLPDLNKDDTGAKDEGICLYNQIVVDDQIWELASKFVTG